MSKLVKTFLNDKDGISAKDYLMIVSSLVFFVFVVIGLIMLLAGKVVDPMYIDLLDIVSPVLMTITAGIFSVNAVETFTTRERRSTTQYPDNTPEQPVEESTDYEKMI